MDETCSRFAPNRAVPSQMDARASAQFVLLSTADHHTMPIMARARSSKKSRQSITPKGVAAKYAGAPTFYANFAAVASTPQELIIDFCLIAPPVDIDSATQLVNAPVSARIITNLTFGRALVDALTTRLKAAESEASKNAAKSSVKK